MNESDENMTVLESENGKRDMEREEYWNRVLTGDVSTIPQDVREASGIVLPAGEDDEERLAGHIVRSWAVDHTRHSKEKIMSDWGEIRREIAGGNGTRASVSDRELFYVLSEKARVKRNDREQLGKLYVEAYEKALQNREGTDDEQVRFWKASLPETLHEVAEQVIRRGLHEGGDDRRRLETSANHVWEGMKSFMLYEGVDVDEEDKNEGILSKIAYNPLMRALWHTPDIGKATEVLQSLNEEDRQKVYSMLAPRMKERVSLPEGITRSVNRGLMNTAYNAYLAKVNSDALFWLKQKDSWEKAFPGSSAKIEKKGNEIAEKARIFNELRAMTQDRMFPVHAKDASWIDDLLVDGAYNAAPAALAFAGGAGIGLLSIAETGRQMEEAREMNPDGDYEAQMRGATGSGLASALLSLGMTKLGQKMAETAFHTFKSVRGMASSLDKLRTIAGEGGNIALDTGMMVAENKLQELVQYGGQEAAALVSGKESGVPWEAWKERNLSLDDQLKEAATMFPYILLGAGKIGLRHFRNPESILNNRKALGRFGISEKIADRIRREPDMDTQTSMLKHAIATRPVWGTVFLGKKAYEWACLLENPKQPLFSSPDEVRDFMDMTPVTVEKPWKPSGELADLWYGSRKAPDETMAIHVARERWMIRAGLPDMTVRRDGQRKKGKRFLQETDDHSLTDWFRKEQAAEQRNLSILNSDPNQSVLPLALREGGGFHPNLQKARLAFLDDSAQTLVKHAYRMLLLKYPDPDLVPDVVQRKPEAWDKCTENMQARLKTIVLDGALQLADERSVPQVDYDITRKFWRTWVEDASPSQVQEMTKWIDELNRKCPESYRDKLGLCRDFDPSVERSGEQMVDYLVVAEDWASAVPSSVRELMPENWKALNRISWSLKAHARTLREMIPGLQDFDLTVIRGMLPRDGYADLTLRELRLKPEQIHKDFLSSSISRSKEELNVYQFFDYMKPAVKYLEMLTPDFITVRRIGSRSQFFRVQYPDGNLSPWHPKKEYAIKDLAAHMAIMFSPEGSVKWDMSRKWALFAVEKGMVFRMDDFNVVRLKSPNIRGSLYEQLTAHAVAELVEAGYGQRSFRSPGEKIIIAPNDTGSKTGLLNQTLEKMRKEIYRKYVGPVRDMGCAAANGMGFGADGILWNNIVLYDHLSPLAMIEDKAEVIWSRLLATGQLPVDEGCRILAQCGRTMIPEAEFARNAHLLVEELSQLSKEYYMAHLDHASIPQSVPMWLKYTAVRPFPDKREMSRLQTAVEECAFVPDDSLTFAQKEQLRRWAMAMDTREVRNLVDAAQMKTWEKPGLPGFFAGMIADSTGMNNIVRSERVWALDGRGKDSLLNALAEGYRDATGAEFHYYPAMERYVHAILGNRLPEILPGHILGDLKLRLTELPPVPSKVALPGLDHGENLLANLSIQLERMPELSFWKSRSDGTYAVLGELGEANASFPTLDSGNWDTPVTGKKVMSGYGPRVGRDYTLDVRNTLPDRITQSPSTLLAFRTLEMIREEFASRPVPTSAGIVWGERLFLPIGEERPYGISTDWEARPVFSEVLSRWGTLPPGEVIAGIRVPDSGGISAEELQASTGSMCVLRDPEDPMHTVRLMPGIPHAPLPEARAPFVVHQYHGVFLDAEGRPVFPEEPGRSYIPLECFRGAKVDCDMSPGELDVWRRMAFHHYLEELGDMSLHQRRWWTPGMGDSSYQEAVIRLYEELGIGHAVEQGKMMEDDPRFIQMLRMILPLMSKPGYLYSFDQYDGSNHQSAIGDGAALYQIYSDNPL